MKKILLPKGRYLLLVAMLIVAVVFAKTEKFDIKRIIGMDDYDFITPEGWQVQKFPDHILLQNMGSGCAIRMIVPQPSSGDLEKDVKNVFGVMYQGWQFQKSGEQQYVLSKGFLPKG